MNDDQLNKAVRMTDEEKKRIYNHLSAMVAATPESVPSFKVTPSPFFSFQFSRTRAMVLAVLAIFVLTGGVSFAAQDALPGDSLYPIKTNVNEKVAGLLVFNTKAKTDYEAGIAFRRLEEAEKLGAMGKLDENAKTEIESNFNEHAEKLEGKLSVEESTNFQSKLEAHRNILLKLAAKVGDGEHDRLHTLAAKLSAELGTSTDKEDQNQTAKKENRAAKVKIYEKAIENNWQGVVNVHSGEKVQLNDDATSTDSHEDELDSSIDIQSHEKEEVHDNSPNNGHGHSSSINIGGDLDLNIGH